MPNQTNTPPGILINETYESLESMPLESAGDNTKKASDKEASKPLVKPKARLRGDAHIWGIFITLLIVALVELFSASATEVTAGNIYGPLIRHARFLIIGVVVVLIHQRFHYRYFRHFAWLMAIGSLLLLIASAKLGVNINGAQRAIVIAGNTIQPAEIVKLSVVVLLATVLARNQMSQGVTTRGVVIAATVVLVFGAALYRNGLTNMLLLMGVSVCMFVVGGIQWKKLLIVFVAYGAAGGMLLMIKSTDDDKAFNEAGTATEQTAQVDRDGTRKNRISRFFAGVNADDPITDENRQVVFSKFALANGGLLGNGPGNSRESARLPLAFSDYIYAIVVEDMGFVGGIVLLMLYFFLLFRAGVIARKCSRAFPAFLIMGCALLIVFQALVHMAIVTGLFPVSGQPLPFISKGGTSVIVMAAAVGMMLSVSRYAVTSGNKKDIRAELKELPDDLHAANPSFIDPNAK